MKMNRRMFLTGVAMAAVVGMVGPAKAAGETLEVGGRKFVAACPPVTGEMTRWPGPPRVGPDGAPVAERLVGR